MIAFVRVSISTARPSIWIAGRSPPPRASEGLNDPISVAAIFHIALSRDEDLKDPVARATLNALRQVLDDRTEAETYATSDLAHFGPLWRQVSAVADAPFPSGDLLAVASRVLELAVVNGQRTLHPTPHANSPDRQNSLHRRYFLTPFNIRAAALDDGASLRP